MIDVSLIVKVALEYFCSQFLFKIRDSYLDGSVTTEQKMQVSLPSLNEVSVVGDSGLLSEVPGDRWISRRWLLVHYYLCKEKNLKLRFKYIQKN